MDPLLLGHLVLVAFLFAWSSSCCHGATATSTVDGITAIYNFGDSISDTGNFIREGANGMTQYLGMLPYGIDFDLGNDPTGRASNGYLMIDFLARYLGLPLINPYLDKGADFTHGVNFAVVGATALSTTDLVARGVTIPHTNSSLDVQLQWFKDFVASTTTNSSKEVREKLASSLVLLGEIGGNDYNYGFLQAFAMYGGYDNITRMILSILQAAKLVPPVVQSIADAAKELLEMGALRIVIPGNFPVGCLTVYLATVNTTEPFAYDGDGCLTALNAFAVLQNARLRAAIAELRLAYPRATIAYADYYAAYLAILRRARALGFDPAETQTACCGAGGGKYNFDPARMCGAPGTSVCADRAAFMSWDGIHPTQHVYGVMADLLYRGGLASPPPITRPVSPMN